MMKKKLLVVGGLVAALAVPAGVAVAATDSPPDNAPATEVDRPGFGPHGRMMGGVGDPEDCPFYDSEARQDRLELRDQWRQERDQRRPQGEEWQQHRHEREQHREQMHEQMRAQFDD